MTGGSTLRVLPCICPECGAELDGLQNDRVLFCGSCQRAVEFFVQGPRTVNLRFVEPQKQVEGVLFYLPAWHFRVTQSYQGKNARRFEKKGGTLFSEVFVMGFRMHGMTLYGDLNQKLSYPQPELHFSKQSYPMYGGWKTSALAREMVTPLVGALIDRKMDISGVEINVEILGVQALGLPFFDTGKFIVDGVMGIETLAIAFDDLPELRKRLKLKAS